MEDIYLVKGTESIEIKKGTTNFPAGCESDFLTKFLSEKFSVENKTVQVLEFETKELAISAAIAATEESLYLVYPSIYEKSTQLVGGTFYNGTEVVLKEIGVIIKIESSEDKITELTTALAASKAENAESNLILRRRTTEVIILKALLEKAKSEENQLAKVNADLEKSKAEIIAFKASIEKSKAEMAALLGC